MTDQHDPLDRMVQLRDEIDSHRDRLAALSAELADKDPKAVAQALTNEVCDTVMSLLADFASATTDVLQDTSDYIDNELAPEVFGDEPDDPEAPDESQLTLADAQEYTALLSAYRAMLFSSREAASDPELQSELDSWMARIDKQVARTVEITMEPEEPETEAEQANGAAEPS